jgi:hypothetical protein
MAAPRYAWLDEYTTEELREHLTALAPQDKIDFFERLQRETPNFSIHQLAEVIASDESPFVRAWAARTHGLRELRDDENLLVRAARMEYPESWPKPDDEALIEFQRATMIERLAWVRSAYFPRNLLEIIFDSVTTMLNLSHVDRARLVLAFLSGARFPVSDEASSGTWEGDLGDKLWERAIRWTDRVYSQMRPHVFEHVRASDKARLLAIQSVRDRASRHAILRHAAPGSDCVALCLDDDDDDIRGHAWARVQLTRRPYEEDPRATQNWKRALDGFDLAALRGLCRNPTLSTSTRLEVVTRLRELGDVDGVLSEQGSIDGEIQREREKYKERSQSTGTRLTELERELARTRRKLGLVLLLLGVLLALSLVETLRKFV